MSDEENLVAAAMRPPRERLVELHRRLDPSGTSLLSVEQLVVNLQEANQRLVDKLSAAGEMIMMREDRISQLTRRLADESKEETMNNEIPQVMEVANPAERQAAGVDDALARWRGFSDEELQALREMSSQRSTSAALDQERRALNFSVQKEQARRKSEQTSYRGPGRYVTRDGRRLEVLGTVGDSAVMKDRAQAVMRYEGDHSGVLMNEYLSQFNEIDDRNGRRVYEYLGPLEEITPAAVTNALSDALARADNALEAVAMIGERLGV